MPRTPLYLPLPPHLLLVSWFAVVLWTGCGNRLQRQGAQESSSFQSVHTSLVPHATPAGGLPTQQADHRGRRRAPLACQEMQTSFGRGGGALLVPPPPKKIFFLFLWFLLQGSITHHKNVCWLFAFRSPLHHLPFFFFFLKVKGQLQPKVIFRFAANRTVLVLGSPSRIPYHCSSIYIYAK